MASWEWRRSVANAAILVDVADDHDLTRTDLLRGTGIDPVVLKTPGAEISAAQELKLVRNLVTLLGDPPGLGCEAGARTRVTTHGVVGMAILSSPTLRSALDIGLRYISLMTSFARLWHVDKGDEIWLYIDDSDLPADLRCFLAERDVSALLTNWFLMHGEPPAFKRGEMVAVLQPRIKPLVEEFGIPITTAENVQLVVIDTSDVDKPMPHASAMTSMLFEEQCAELLQRRGLCEGVAGSVREVLLRQMNGRITQEDVAERLHMSLRTMRRRLSEEGTSYRRLCVETYGALAEELLATGLTVEDVAYRMGYAGAPSFSNAFKQWRGVPPGRYARTFGDRQRPAVHQ
ncbi:AraC family transcriptional regulator ligand-binding domain-containing protein [Nocardia sp. XZ_19_385]|uniref:AraC family transcriptional regulator n=1 Tax=Nocardia sp. XZ_19_385 TaxID=2769488 RepID=UPI0028160F86|nr:AraC family transcriptional regulator ligand-binding domain-containing protein [Nocardia sp. XZ_19_385]